MTTIKLTVINGPNKGRSLTLGNSESCLVGRGPMAEFVVIDLRMSREHFLIAACDGYWWARDLNSRHGTFVNEQRIKEKFLEQDDMILAGDTSFLVSFLDAAVGGQQKSLALPPHFDCSDSLRKTWTRREA